MTLTADPRLRARQVAVARSAGHRRLAALSGGLGVVALVVTALVILHSSLLSAKVVHLRGARHEPRGEVLAVTGLDAHPPLVDLSTAAARAALERLPWVRTARVVADWPDGVSVTLTERRPVAEISLSGGGEAVVDATGRILETGVPPQPGLLTLGGIASIGPPGTTLQAARPALQVAAGLPASLASRVASIGGGASGVELRLAGGPTVVLGGPGDLEAKLTALVTLLDKVSLHGIVTIDLRAPGQPVLTR